MKKINIMLSKWKGIAFALPSTLLIIVLFIYPFLLSFQRSFQLADDSYSLLNYVQSWERYSSDIFFTVFISLVSLFILLLLSIILSGVLRLYSFAVVEFIFKIPLFVPYVVVGHAVRVFLAPHGTLTSLLNALNIVNPDNLPQIAFSSAGLIFALVWKNLGISLLLVLGSFRGVNQNMLEAAESMGASKYQLVKDFLVPICKSSFGVIAVLTFTSMMGSFSIPAMIGGGGGSQMLMIDVHQQMIEQQNLGMANAIGVFGYLFSMGATIYYLNGMGKGAETKYGS
ncbi:MAG TPA: sugar ABC transporter permease [Candidatus Avacidaminococcus intestinavium]|uniref:Sugar ABC transporter permease n=1 Tax=Candidatus Avacidaminococcus intestinavium TaxID=2840684 RepID=A0A9D1MP32_9FIRM|nr:sugar ABC transporter permease [Candidatus Avacidaminococcus intestinavium]